MTRTFTPDEIAALIANLEAATGPGRELDDAIARFDGYCGSPLPCTGYTASIDAALTLVPPGFGSISMALNERGKSSARLSHPYVFGNGATPAIAICIAALKARAQIRASGARPTGSKPDEAPPNRANGSVGRDDVGGTP